MPKFIIERNVPGAGKLTEDQLAVLAHASCDVLEQMAPQVQWIQSFVTDDKLFCLYIAPNAAAVREHAQRGHFPADAILAVRAIIDPTTAEMAGAGAMAGPLHS